MSNLKVKDIAERIDAHLKMMEREPSINTEIRKGVHRFFNARAYASGRYVWIVYVTYQGGSSLTKDDAEKYLAALDSGQTTRHQFVIRK